MTTTVPAVQGVEYDKELRSRLVDWLGTPSELRGDALTLPQFAEREGFTVAAVSKLMRTDRGVQDALRSVALGGLFRVPRILETLGDAAEGGSIRAAEIYLDFVRKTLTDQQLMAAMRPSDSSEDMVGEAVKGAQLLLEKARGRKVTVGVQVEEGITDERKLRARSEVTLRESGLLASPVKEDIELSPVDARVPAEAKVETLDAPVRETRGEVARRNMVSWEGRNTGASEA